MRSQYFVALMASLLWFACGAPEEDRVWAPPTASRATLVLEPPILAVGEVASLELAVVTPPDRILRPPVGPASVSGLAILERAPIETRREPARWVHTIVMRLRAVEVGTFELVTGEIEVETNEGGLERLLVPPLSVEVVSVLPDHLGQGSPYGVRRLPRPSVGSAGALGAFAAGMGLTLASLGFLWLVRRRREPSESPIETQDPPVQRAFEWVRKELANAREQAGRDPRAAMDTASQGLRRYVDARFGSDLAARTAEELAAADAPFLLTTRWTALLDLITELDTARFPRAVEAAKVVSLLDRVEAFVSDSAPTDLR